MFWPSSHVLKVNVIFSRIEDYVSVDSSTFANHVDEPLTYLGGEIRHHRSGISTDAINIHAVRGTRTVRYGLHILLLSLSNYHLHLQRLSCVPG